MDAKQLIEHATAVARAVPSTEALAELRKVLDFNDSRARSGRGRVSALRTCEMLTAMGFPCSRSRLDRLCRDIGRKGWAEA